MDIENDFRLNSLSDSDTESDIMINPVELKLPSTNLKKTATGNSNSQANKKDDQNDVTTLQRELVQAFIGMIIAKKYEILYEKNQKLATKIMQLWNDTTFEKPINIIALKGLQNSIGYLHHLYNTLEADIAQDLNPKYKMVLITQENNSLKYLLSVLKERLDDMLIEKPKPTSNTKKKTSAEDNKASLITNLVMFFEGDLNDSKDYLLDFCKFFNEEYLEVNKNLKLWLMFLADAPIDLISSLECNFKIMKTHDPKKLFSKLLLNLIKDIKFSPKLHISFIKKLLEKFDNYQISFEHGVQGLITITQDYVLQKSIKTELELLELVSLSDPNKVNFEYMQMSLRINYTIDIFQSIEKSLFNHKKNFANRMLNFLFGDHIAYHIPLNIQNQLKTYDDFNELCKQIQNILKGIKSLDFKLITDRISNLICKDKNSSNSIGYLSKNKADKRLSTLLSGSKSKEKNQLQQNLTLLCDELSNNLRLMIQNHFLNVYKQIQENYKTLTYNDYEEYTQSTNPDILGKILKGFIYSEKRNQIRYETSLLVDIIKEYGININMDQTYEAFKETILKSNKKRTEADIKKLFRMSLTELKYLGLILETKKAKHTFEKNFFGKTHYKMQNMNQIDEETKNESDCS